MFVQATTSSRPNGKTYVSYLVRESFRTPQGPRSRTVCNITDLPAPTRALIAASLQGQAFLPAAALQLAEALDYGGLAVLNDAWARFGLGDLFAGLGSPRQRALLQAVIYSRLLFPCAKLSLAQQAAGTWLAPACGLPADEAFDEDDIYDAMDQLNGQWVSLEKQLYQRAFPQAVRLVLYDLTSVYFEGAGPEPLAQYGHSRDHRSDRPQILLAVATDTQGVPLHVSVLRGNRNDTQTLQGLLHTLRRRFGIREATFVFDGGMSSRINLRWTRPTWAMSPACPPPPCTTWSKPWPWSRSWNWAMNPSSWKSRTRANATSSPGAPGANNAIRRGARAAWPRRKRS